MTDKTVTSVHLSRDEEDMLEMLALYFQCDQSIVVKLALESLYETVTELELASEMIDVRLPETSHHSIPKDLVN